MINLLPSEEKQKLFSEKKEKLTIIWGIIFLVSLVCLTLILLSIKFYILAETDFQKNVVELIRQENQIPDFANLNSTIQKYNGILAQLDSFYKKEIYFNQVLKIVTDIPKPNGLYITNFLLDRNEGGTVKVRVSGTSDTRDNLLIFKKNIEEGSTISSGSSLKIKNPYFSSESWVNPKNVNYSLTFEIGRNY